MQTTEYGRGPFGNYKRGTPGHVLNALCHFGIPVRRVESLDYNTVAATANGMTLKADGEVYATVRYFDEIEQPLFRFTDPHLSGIQNDDGYQLTLSASDMACFAISGPWATEKHFDAINALMKEKLVSDSHYKATMGGNAFFQRGNNDRSGKDFLVEFWKPKGAQVWMHFFNAEYKRQLTKSYKLATKDNHGN